MEAGYKKQFIISGVVIVAAALGAFALFHVFAGDIEATVAKILKDEETIAAQAASLGDAALLTKQAPDAVRYQAAMDKLLPRQDGLIGFGQWISTLGAQHQISATASFRSAANPLGAPVAAGDVNFNQTNFALSANGNLNDIVAFLADIESKAPGYLLHFSDFDLVNNNAIYQLQAQGVVYSRD